MVSSDMRGRPLAKRRAALLVAGFACFWMYAARAERHPSRDRSQYGEGDVRIITLGTSGGPIVRAKRASESTLLVVGGTLYMVDCGEGALRRLVEAGFVASDVGKLFITHQHMDHVLDLPSLIAYDWQFDDRRTIKVFGPSGLAATVAHALEFLDVGEKLFSPQMPPHPAMKDIVDVTELGPMSSQPTQIYKDAKVRVLAVENTHYSQLPPTGLPFVPRSYSYRFETTGRTVVFTGDTGPSAALTALAKGADVLVSEVIQPEAMIDYLRRKTSGDPGTLAKVIDHMRHEHLTPDEVGKLAEAAGVKEVVMSHIVPGADDEVRNIPYLKGVKEHFAGPVYLANDLDEF